MKLQRAALFCAIGFALLAPSFASADIMALYEFDTVAPFSPFVDGNGNERDISRDLNPDVIAGNYNTRTNRTSATSTGGIAQSPVDVHAFARTNTTPNDIRLANNNVYHEFEVTIANGSWTIDSLHFEYWVNDTTPGETYQATVYSDLVPNGYNAGLELATESYVRQTNLVPEIHNVTINGLQFRPEFQNLQPGDTAQFRIVFSDDVSAGSIVHRIDDVELRGFQSTAIPEPAAATILMFIAGYAATRRRRVW
jgi:hypothetical protein